MDEEEVMYLALTGMVEFMVLIFATSIGGILGIIMILIALFGLVAILILNFADFIIFSTVMSLFKIKFQPVKNYYITTKQNAIIKNVNGLFYATGYMTGNLFAYTFKEEKNEDNIEEQIVQAPDRWERALMSIKFPFRYHIIATGLNVQKVRDEIEGKRGYNEFQLSRAMQTNSNELTITELQRKINIMQSRIDRISNGERPLASLMYLETTAVGISEKAALDSLSDQISQLQVSLSSFDLDLIRITGRELHQLFYFNFSIPLTFESLAAYFNQQE